jgi:hypothetical protein
MAKHVSDRRKQRAPNLMFYKGGGIAFTPPPQKKQQLNSKLEVLEIVHILQSNRIFSCKQHCNIVPQYIAILIGRLLVAAGDANKLEVEIRKKSVNKASDWTIRKR